MLPFFAKIFRWIAGSLRKREVLSFILYVLLFFSLDCLPISFRGSSPDKIFFLSAFAVCRILGFCFLSSRADSLARHLIKRNSFEPHPNAAELSKTFLWLYSEIDYCFFRFWTSNMLRCDFSTNEILFCYAATIYIWAAVNCHGSPIRCLLKGGFWTGFPYITLASLFLGFQPINQLAIQLFDVQPTNQLAPGGVAAALIYFGIFQLEILINSSLRLYLKRNGNSH